MPVLTEELQLSTLVDLATDYSKNLFKARNNKGYLDRSSIMKAKKDLVLSFPVLCSDTISADTAMMITKAIERECCTTLQMIFAANFLSGSTGVEAIKQWHTNMGDLNFAIDKMDIDDYLDISDAISASIGENAVVTGIEIKSLQEQFIQDQMHRFPVSSFNENGLDCYSVIPESGKIIFEARRSDKRRNNNNRNTGFIDSFKDAYGRAVDRELKAFNAGEKERADAIKRGREALGARDREFWRRDKEERDRARHNLQMGLDKARDRREDEYHKHRIDLDRRADDRAERQYGLDFEKNARDALYQARKDEREARKDEREARKDERERLDSEIQFMKAQLLDTDVRKANELVPSLLIIRYYNTDNIIPDGSGKANPVVGPIEQQFIIGVKARLIPVPSAEIVSNLVSANKTKVSFINFIRATTKEISFAKDFVAAIDQAKIDAKKNSKLSKTSPIWRSLQSRAVKSKVNRLLRSVKANDASAITTLVMTEEEVNIMKKEFDFDIYTAKNTRFIMDTFNFMGMVVVDEAVEVSHFYLDGNEYWEDYPFSSLERETGDSSYKKIINLMSKINRV